MDSQTVIAVCATVIAIASLVVSVYQVRATRLHNRHTLRPLLQLRKDIAPYPRASALSDGMGVPPGFTDYLLTVDDYNPAANSAFLNLIVERVDLEIRYESLYGGENYTVSTRKNSWWQSEIPPAHENASSESAPAIDPPRNDISVSDGTKLAQHRPPPAGA